MKGMLEKLTKTQQPGNQKRWSRIGILRQVCRNYRKQIKANNGRTKRAFTKRDG